MHGYQRNTIEVDLLVRPDDSEAVSQALMAAGFGCDAVGGDFAQLDGLPVHLVMAASPAGKGSEVLLPDPADADATTRIEGLSVLTLAKLIESKLACGEAELRRTHKDFADVVELIACNSLGGDFVRKLHKAVRPRFRELVRRVKDT